MKSERKTMGKFWKGSANVANERILIGRRFVPELREGAYVEERKTCC